MLFREKPSLECGTDCDEAQGLQKTKQRPDSTFKNVGAKLIEHYSISIYP